MNYKSVILKNIVLKNVNKSIDYNSSLFEWNVVEGKIGTFKQGDRLMTNLSATYDNEKINDYKIVVGSLPKDINFDTQSGALDGVLNETGEFNFTINATAKMAVSHASYSVTIL